MRKAFHGVLDRPWVILLAAGFVLFGYWAVSTRQQTYEVKAAFAYAVNLAPGLDVKISGIDAGKVTSVDFDKETGQAVVGIGIDDERVWPLHRGTQVLIRWGTTVGNGTRYLTVVPGPKSAPEIENGGIIGSSQTVSPVEFDDVFNIFDEDTRRHFVGLFDNGSRTLTGRERQLGFGVEKTPAALDATGGVLRELVSDEKALQDLIRYGDRTTSIIAAEDEQLKRLITGLARTMDAFHDHSKALGTDIEQFPETLADTRTTLTRLDTTVNVLDGLVADVRPGARAIRPLASTARPALAELRATVPQALSTIETVTDGAPAVERMLQRGQPFADDLDPVLSKLAPQLSCIRPYAPEIAGFFTNWAGWSKNFDSIENYARVRFNTGFLSSNEIPKGTPSTFATDQGLSYGFPYPPGFNAGKPRFDEKCGVTPDAIDPTKDYEDREGLN